MLRSIFRYIPSISAAAKQRLWAAGVHLEMPLPPQLPFAPDRPIIQRLKRQCAWSLSRW